MTLDTITGFISALGFPVFVAIYLMIRTDKILQENTNATKDLTAFLKAHLSK